MKNYRNDETLKALKNSEGTTVLDNKAAIASAWASQNVAESVQGLEEMIKDSTKNIIESNKNLSHSNEKYAFALNFLTGILVIVGIIQTIKLFY